MPQQQQQQQQQQQSQALSWHKGRLMSTLASCQRRWLN
jgi:hypothetical protein